MCGICGQINFVDEAPVRREILLRMTQTIVHRGPDDEGIFLNGNVGLGFRRLSILDLSPAGHQPMCDEEGKIWIVFNGEIYNFKELRHQLEQLGHRFKSQCDTEVILYGYKQWGDAVLDRLNGMFGLAIWEEKRRRLLLARDPFGIKPVYYSITDGRLLFGSEIRPIVAGMGKRPDVDPVALNLFLRYRYTPAPLTLYSGIKKLAPGQLLIVENGKFRVSRWYNYVPQPFSSALKDEDAKEALLDLYKRSVKRHLISDVPVGLLLSGGMDSGLLLGLMNLFGKSWPTFTVGYGSSFKDDELVDAAESARVYSAKNVSVKIDRTTFERTLPKIVGILEEPVASASIVPMYFVSERARQDVKVALIGQGPDELFGGYTRHLGVQYGSYWRRLPGCIRTPLSRVINSLPRQEALKRAVYSLDIQDRMKRYQQVFSIQTGDTIDSLFHKEILPANAGDSVLDYWSDLAPIVEKQDELNGFQTIELRSALADELLMYADKMSMAHSLEVRVPFLDREVVEHVQCLAASFKVRYGKTKWLHRQVCHDFLPASIVNRRKKGFAVNVTDDWFHASLGGKMENLFLDEKSLMYRFLQPKVVQRLHHEHLCGKHDNHKILFSLVVFEQWLNISGI